MKVLHFDCFSGISGDMTLAALLHAGLPQEYLEKELAKLNLHGHFSLKVLSDSRHGISGTKVNVETDSHHHREGHHDHHHRHYTDIVEMISSSGLCENVKTQALKFFSILGEAEAKIHQIPIEDVHFHEVGAIDSIVDLVGVAIGIDYFHPDKITSSPVPQGVGVVQCDHGVMPNPAPATVEILKGIPIIQLPINFELTTPTGATIIRGLVDEFSLPPSFLPSTIGYGLGSFSFKERANILRIFLGEVKEHSEEGKEKITKIEVNIDDMSPQLYEPLIQELFKAGAVDVAMIPIQMKKQRPATRLEILLPQEIFSNVSSALFRHSTTIGFRYQEMSRVCLRREISGVKTRLGEIPIKRSYLGETVVQTTPEYDACVEIAHKTNLPVKDVLSAAHQALQTEG